MAKAAATHPVVLVTGGSSGIGRAICKHLSAEGFIVYGTSRRAKVGDQLDNFNLIGLDVNDRPSIESAVDHIVSEHGRIDGLVNNAGLGIVGPLEQTELESIRTIFETNVFGAISVTQAVLPQMRKQKSGMIINISSIGGVMGLPYRSIYSSSKFAVEGWSEALSMELKPFGVQVVIVEPGDFKTSISDRREVSELQSDSPYKSTFDRIHQQINEEVATAKDPILVARMISKVLRTKKPRLRYKVGTFMQKFSVRIKRMLPGRMFERLLAKHYNLDK